MPVIKRLERPAPKTDQTMGERAEHDKENKIEKVRWQCLAQM